jgi:hypothetical protein
MRHAWHPTELPQPLDAGCKIHMRAPTSSANHTSNMPLPTAEEILDTPKQQRPLPVDANVVAYFGDLLLNLVQVPANSDRSGRSGTASSRDPS